MQNLPTILSPEVVIALDDRATESIAGESTESVQERIRVSEKLAILQLSLKTLKGLEGHKPLRLFSSTHIGVKKLLISLIAS